MPEYCHIMSSTYFDFVAAGAVMVQYRYRMIRNPARSEALIIFGSNATELGGAKFGNNIA